MAPANVLRIPRTDKDGTCVLVHTTQVRSKALDMKLVGTDGLAPYATTIRHSQAASFMVKNCPISEEEWVSTLTSLLRQEHVDGMETVATVESESVLVITFRKRVRGITQRLGAIELKHEPDEEIELYDWCSISAQAYDQARETLASVTAKTSELEETVARLRRQLDEIVDAKKSDEAELLVKFRDLLNEKKVKIREQQSLLAAATAAASDTPGEPVKFEPVSEDEAPAPAPTAHRKPGKSRVSKRKQPVQQEEESEDDGFEEMDVDPAPKEPPADASDDDRNTTEAETETASEDEGEEVPAPAAKPKPAAQPAQRVTRGREAKAAPKEPAAPPKRGPSPSAPDNEELPPKRALPFGRKKAPPAKKTPPPAAGDETESDDEL